MASSPWPREEPMGPWYNSTPVPSLETWLLWSIALRITQSAAAITLLAGALQALLLLLLLCVVKLPPIYSGPMN